MTAVACSCRVLAVGALAVAGCGDKKLDTGKLEGRPATGSRSRRGVEVGSVECPQRRRGQAGRHLHLQGDPTSGQTASVKVTQQDDKGNVNYQVGAAASGAPAGVVRPNGVHRGGAASGGLAPASASLRWAPLTASSVGRVPCTASCATSGEPRAEAVGSPGGGSALPWVVQAKQSRR